MEQGENIISNTARIEKGTFTNTSHNTIDTNRPWSAVLGPSAASQPLGFSAGVSESYPS